MNRFVPNIAKIGLENLEGQAENNILVFYFYYYKDTTKVVRR